jgi:hypothetical protein
VTLRCKWRRLAGAAVLFWLAAGAQAQAPAAQWEVSAGVLHRRLVERADDGARLVTESGPLLRLAASGQLALPSGGSLRAEAGVAGGELDYTGRTQGGAPLTTDSRHRELDATLAWRPWPAAAWGEAWLLLHALQQRRDIAGTAGVGGLRETSTLLLPGLRWSRDFDAAGWRWQPSVEVRASVWHQVDVDYHGVFDSQDLDGGHRNELALALRAWSPASPWRWSVEWTRSQQSPSHVDTVRRSGAAVGTVRQPRIEIDDVMLRATRAF